MNVTLHFHRGLSAAAPAAVVSVQSVPCTETTMRIFDRLYDSGIVRGEGRIKECMEEWIDDLVLADELRKVLK